MPPAESFLSPFTAPKDRVPLATQVRGTVLLSSLRGLRRHGLGDRYLAALEPHYREVIASLTAPTWFPIDVALAHYAACDRLKLDRETIVDIGSGSGLFINETVLSTVAKLSTESGLTPWFVLSLANKLCARTRIGLSPARGFGPKEARLEWIQQPVARFPYFRTAFGAFAVIHRGEAREKDCTSVSFPTHSTRRRRTGSRGRRRAGSRRERAVDGGSLIQRQPA